MINQLHKDCCELSIAAYQNTNTLCNDYRDVRFHSSDETDAQCFTAIKEGKFFITFRGTESLRDWLSDANTIRVPMDLPSIKSEDRPKVHWGFLRQFRSLQEHIVNDILDYVQVYGQNSIIIITGHSLGAAQASLAALYFSLFYPNIPVSCFTFGSPRVGHTRFRKLFKERVYQHIRFVNENDPVTMIPFATRFVHLPNVYHINHKCEASRVDEGRWSSMFKDLLFSMCCGNSPIDDHDCSEYQTKLKRLSPS